MLPRVDCVLPGLFDLPLEELGEAFLRQRLPGLNRLLRLARPLPNQVFSLDSILRRALGWQTESDTALSGLPMAQAFAGPEARSSNRYMLFQAIHLKPDLHSALILPIHESLEKLNDISLIINDLKNEFKANCDITAVSDGVFLMQLYDFDAPVNYPHPLSVYGKPANPYIEQSRMILPWYQLMNEMQMFLHQHEINQKRLQSGLLPANSLWFWGAGPVRTVDPAPGWYCDDELFNRFAQSLGLEPEPCNALASASNASSLVIDLRLIRALKSGQGEPLDDLLLSLEFGLFQPLLASVENQQLRLVLRAGFRFDFELRPLSRFKFWKPPMSLIEWRLDSRES